MMLVTAIVGEQEGAAHWQYAKYGLPSYKVSYVPLQLTYTSQSHL